MYTKFEKKNKVYQGYNVNDLKERKAHQVTNLTLDDFNVISDIINQHIPYVMTTIDPEYITDVSCQPRKRIFRMKTDIMTLREITRKKFLIYAAQRRYLEKYREAGYQEQTYKFITQLHQFAATSLCESELEAYTELKRTQRVLENLQTKRFTEECKTHVAKNQRILIEVQEICGRFFFLLKLIGYFDEITGSEDMENKIIESENYKVILLAKIVDVQMNEGNPFRENEISSIISYVDKIVRPYLAKRNDLNADIWMEGYHRTRRQIFNYNHRFNCIALLNYLVAIVVTKSEKVLTQNIKKDEFIKDGQFLKLRIKFLNQRSLEILSNFQNSRKKDGVQIKLNSLLPVILESIKHKLSKNITNVADQFSADNSKGLNKLSLTRISNKSPNFNTFLPKNSDNFTLETVNNIHWHLMCLLQNLDKIPSDKYIKIEKQVRKRIQAQKELSRQVLVKRNRLQNWMDHFKKHDQLQRL